MNKTILLLVTCLFAGICLYGQESENGFVIRLDGNYNETAASNTQIHIVFFQIPYSQILLKESREQKQETLGQSSSS
jgi:Ser-tRNA(Ala) deacylase AlaX